MNKKLPSRKLLILDEAHMLETEVVKFRSIAISRKKWRKYIPDLIIDDHGYDVKGWLGFLNNLKEMMLDAIEVLLRNPKGKEKEKGNEELLIELNQNLDKLESVIKAVSVNPNNWIVSDVQRFPGISGNEVIKVELKPLDVSPYCKEIFEKCTNTLMMSATILDKLQFCTGVGPVPDEVKFIQVGSDFPVQNRPIYPLNIEYLNYRTLQENVVQQKIARIIDKIMTHHKNQKGLIHTTSYKQLNFITENICQDNRRRLLETDSEVERDEIIIEHINTTKPTVLISPSLFLGVDLKDNLSRFQVITKVPYPSLGDRWIAEKRKRNENWYQWQTIIRLIQSYGRSVRSKDDYAVTYILDSLFQDFIDRNKDIIPPWFSDAIN